MLNISQPEINRLIKTIYPGQMNKEAAKLLKKAAETEAEKLVTECLNEAIELAELNKKSINIQHVKYFLSKKGYNNV